jgi:hypothetical protein
MVLGRYLLLSLALHLAVLVAIEGVRYLQKAHPDWLPEWMQARPVEEAQVDPTAEYIPEPDEVEIPFTFIEVDPTSISTEEPEFAQYYSTASTLAGNPNPPKEDTESPAFDGTQPDSERTFTVLQPTLEAPIVAEALMPDQELSLTPVQDPQVERSAPMETLESVMTAEEVLESETVEPEDRIEVVMTEAVDEKQPVETEFELEPIEIPAPKPLEMARANPPPSAAGVAGPLANRRFQSLRDARQAKGILVGEKMQQEGGVHRHQLQSSLDVKSSPYADYDRQFIYAVQQHWHDLLSRHRFALDRTGKVVLSFKLRSNGTVSDMTLVHSDVGDIWSFICESAVISPSPYAKWPTEMRNMVGADYREVTFTFRYY